MHCVHLVDLRLLAESSRTLFEGPRPTRDYTVVVQCKIYDWRQAFDRARWNRKKHTYELKLLKVLKLLRPLSSLEVRIDPTPD